MSKYEEMRIAHERAVNHWREFEKKCRASIYLLVTEFQTISDIPDGYIEYVPLNKEPADGMNYTVHGATQFDEQDGYWHTGIRINLDGVSSILLGIGLTEENGSIKVKQARDAKPQVIDIDSEQDRRKFYESIVNRVKDYFLSDWEKPERNEHRIGFN